MQTLGTPPATGTNVVPFVKEETKPSIRAIARQQGIDLGSLLSILSYRRPADSETEQKFVEMFLDPIEGMKMDDYGNRYIMIGANPKVMWSCHTDTVSREGGMQNIKWNGDILSLNQGKSGQSLGADDGAGMWLLLEMLKEGKEGLYIFHRDEECGGLGSKWIAKNNPDLVDGIEMAIAFDRRATHSIITRQRGSRCCSDKFGKALADELSKTEGLSYRLDPTGTFTDTASYTDLIAECTNVSVGYYNEHSDRETLDVAHLLSLREALLALDPTALPVERKPGDDDRSHSYGYGYGSYGSNSTSTDPLSRMEKICQDRPMSVARILHNMGLSPWMLEQMIEDVWKTKNPTPSRAVNQNTSMQTREDAETEWQGILADYYRDRPQLMEDADLALELGEDDIVDYKDVLWCDDCGDYSPEEWTLADPQDGDFCGLCYGQNTEAMEAAVNGTGGVVEVAQ